MRLTGIEIIVSGKKKFIGKVGLTPRNSILPQLDRVPLLYREVPFKDLYSHKTDSIGVDAAGWEKAEELGAAGMLCYCKDERKFFYVPASLLNECRVVDLGEFPQYRVPLMRAQSVKAAAGLNFGWTSVTVQAEAVRSAPQTLLSETQLSLFAGQEAA